MHLATIPCTVLTFGCSLWIAGALALSYSHSHQTHVWILCTVPLKFLLCTNSEGGSFGTGAYRDRRSLRVDNENLRVTNADPKYSKWPKNTVSYYIDKAYCKFHMITRSYFGSEFGKILLFQQRLKQTSSKKQSRQSRRIWKAACSLWKCHRSRGSTSWKSHRSLQTGKQPLASWDHGCLEYFTNCIMIFTGDHIGTWITSWEKRLAGLQKLCTWVNISQTPLFFPEQPKRNNVQVIQESTQTTQWRTPNKQWC